MTVIAGTPRDYLDAHPSTAALVDGALEVHRAPQRAVEILRPPATVTPSAAPRARIAVADLLP